MQLYTNTPGLGIGNGPGYLTPKVSYSGQQAPALNPTQAYAVQTQQAVPEDNWAMHGLKIVSAAPLNIVDTVGALFPNVKRGDINDKVYDSLGMPGAADFVRQNQGGVDVVSGILGSVGLAFATEAALARTFQSAWFASTGLGRVALGLGSKVTSAEAAARSATLAAAQSGENLAWLARPNLDYVLTRGITGVAKAGASEAVIATLMHKNSAVWSDDMTTNLLFAGLGMGLGGLGGVISGRGAVYKWANSDDVMNAFADSADPAKFERIASAIPTGGGLSATAKEVPKPTSELTAMMLNARNEEQGQTAARRAIQTQTEGTSRTLLGQITLKGVTEVPGSKFSSFTRDGTATAEGRHLMETLHADPTALYGADSLGRVDDVDAFLKTRETALDLLKNSGDAAKIQRGIALAKQIPMLLVNKAWVPIKAGRMLLGVNPETDIKFMRSGGGAHELQWQGPSGGKFVMNESGGLNKPITQLGTQDLIAVSEAGNRIMTSMLRKAETLTVPAKPDYMNLDFAVEYEKRGGKVDWQKAAGLANAEVAQIESLKQKAVLANQVADLTPEMRLKLNLPQATSSERLADPKGTALMQLLNAAKIQGATTQGLKTLRANIQKIADLTVDTKPLDDLTGDFFNFNRTADAGKRWMSPVIGFFDDTYDAKWTKFDLGESIAEAKATRIGSMLRSSTQLVSNLARTIMSDGNVQKIMNISGLADSQIGGTSNVIGATASQFLTQSHRFRNSEVLSAAQNLRRVVNRTTELNFNEVAKRLKPFVDAFSSVSGKESRILFSQYMSNSAGWDIRGVKALGNGKVGFLLDPTSLANQTRLGRAVAQDELMTNPRTGNVIALDDLGNQARIAWEQESKLYLKELNAVREARGLDPIAHRAFFVNPPKTTGKIVGLTLDAANRPVIGGAIIASDAAEYARKAAALTKTMPAGNRLMRLEEIKAHADLWDRAGLDFIDPTKFTLAGKHQTGSLFSELVNPRAIEDSIDYLKEGYENIANGVTRTVFDSQLRLAQIRSAAEATTSGRAPSTRSIWDEYTQTLMGNAHLSDPRGINVPLKKVDQFLDHAIAAAWPLVRGVSPDHLRDVMDKLGVKAFKGSVKSFSDLANELGPYMPFKDAMDYAEFTHGVKPPMKSKEFARAMNRIGAAVILRWLEIPQAAMNMAGIITNMPGILNSSTVPTIGRVNGVPVIDQGKIMAKGFWRMMRSSDKRPDADWLTMVKNGDTSQDAMDLHQQLSLIQSKSDWMKLMTGDPSSGSWWRRKGIEGVASVLTDTSESLSRRWAHFVGLELADLHGIQGMEARHNFARAIANDAIANYDPLNRPEVFSSAFGTMYGLFLSYAQNYYQRLFRYVEDADYKAFGSSLVAQASMFGFTGIPGARQLMDWFDSGNKQGEPSYLDRIYERFGPATGSVVASGGFNQLVTLFGLPAVALNPRGDINFRHPTLDFMTSGQVVLPIGLEVVKDLAQTSFNAIGAITGAGNRVPSSQAMAEILARNMPNRMMRGAITVLAAGGKESDAYGNMSSETIGMAESAYRILGLRSMRQQSQIEAYFMNQKAKAIDAQRMEGLRETTRALVRSGDLTRLPEVFQKYLDAGGKPWNYTGWIRGMINEADNTRAANQLQKALRSPGSQDLANRIQLMTGGYGDVQ